jgi:hypothetical protein
MGARTPTTVAVAVTGARLDVLRIAERHTEAARLIGGLVTQHLAEPGSGGPVDAATVAVASEALQACLNREDSAARAVWAVLSVATDPDAVIGALRHAGKDHPILTDAETRCGPQTRQDPSEAMTTDSLGDLARSLVEAAETQGVIIAGMECTGVRVSAPTVELRAADPALTPALAAALGLTVRAAHPYEAGRVLEVFTGRMEGVTVRVQHLIPAATADA